MKKILCLLLAVAILPSAALARQNTPIVDDTAASDGKYLIAVNTNPSSASIQQTADIPAANASVQAAGDSDLVPDGTRNIIETAGGMLYEIEPNRDIQPAAARATINFVMLYENDDCMVYLEENAAPELAFTQQTAKQLADYYSQSICQQIQQAFGALPDPQKKLEIFCYDIQDDFDASDSSKWVYVAGQYNSAQYLNGRYAIELDTYPTMSFDTLFPDEIQTADVTKSYGTLAHEFQHLLNFSAYVTRQDRSKSQMALWLNECFSECANEINNPSYTTRITNTQYATVAADLAAGLSLTNWQGKLANYSLSYLFGQYLRTQTKNVAGGGNEIYKRISEIYYTQPGSEWDAIAAAMTEVTGKSWTPEELLFCFRVAMVAQQSNGQYGFGGEDKFRQYLPATAIGGAVSLSGGGATVFNCPAGYRVPAAADSDIRYCVVTPPDIAVARAQLRTRTQTTSASGSIRYDYVAIDDLTQNNLYLYTDFINYTAQSDGPVLFVAMYRDDALLYASRTAFLGEFGANSKPCAFRLPAGIRASIAPGDTVRVYAWSDDTLYPYLQTIYTFTQP